MEANFKEEENSLEMIIDNPETLVIIDSLKIKYGQKNRVSTILFCIKSMLWSQKINQKLGENMNKEEIFKISKLTKVVIQQAKGGKATGVIDIQDILVKKGEIRFKGEELYICLET